MVARQGHKRSKILSMTYVTNKLN